MPWRSEGGRTTPDATVDVQVSLERGAAVVRLGGELDIASVGAVRQRLLDLALDGHVRQVVDLTPLTFMDSAGLGAIVAVRRRLRVLKGSLVVACSNPSILRLLGLTSMDRVLRVYPTVDDAIRDDLA